MFSLGIAIVILLKDVYHYNTYKKTNTHVNVYIVKSINLQ